MQKKLQELLLEMLNAEDGKEIEVTGDEDLLKKFKLLLLSLNQEIVVEEKNRIVYRKRA
ncbi:MAG: hypothetical protein OWQ50_08550 [Acidianus infernus]|uniref:hypothetical protein n=1 Tax=Acidianus infernus TaxID=12915 RepID=UPI0012DCA048|nr:hypothetical protein [Acidianus infernus]MCY0874020.1 hypothetical protein [Acidianus infernus]MCY0883800.1 hypothetical protein [Acidianus infernus]